MPLNKPFDVGIIGGGMVGSTLALALGDAGFKVIILDKADPTISYIPVLDGRTLAIACGSRQFLDKCGLWENLKDNAEPILDIFITDYRSTQVLHYDHKLVSEEPLGHIVEIQTLRQALLEKTRNHPYITWLAPNKLAKFEIQDHLAYGWTEEGIEIQARLLIAADGKDSQIRTLAGIQTVEQDYQTAIVCVVEHPLPHKGQAFEHFLPKGPFALLPMAGGYRSSVVWSADSRLVPHLLQLSDKEFGTEMTHQFDGLGPLKLVSPRWSYPLRLSLAKQQAQKRLLLIGDAAHAIHPIAGQGLNLGLRDVEVLTTILKEGAGLGADIGSLSLLKQYLARRRFDQASLIGMTDGLNRLFSTSCPPIKLVRDLGLGAINQTPSLKRSLMIHAMGLKGAA